MSRGIVGTVVDGSGADISTFGARCKSGGGAIQRRSGGDEGASCCLRCSSACSSWLATLSSLPDPRVPVDTASGVDKVTWGSEGKVLMLAQAERGSKEEKVALLFSILWLLKDKWGARCTGLSPTAPYH